MSGLFLGRAAGQPYRLDPSRLRTHGVVVGMTGSGKTGLSLVMLEELVEAGIPIIAIDPKGDLGNLGLLFGRLEPAEFAPWVGEDDPVAVAKRWKEGLSGWGMDAASVDALSRKLDLQIFTPGSTAGIPLNAVGSFGRPPEAVMEDPEARRELVQDCVSGLLGLVGRSPDPVKDPAHVVLSRILDDAWGAGEDPDLETLVMRLVDPPFQKVGVFPLDRFFPPDDRAELAMAINAIIASPSFAPWTQGEALDVDGMLAPGAKTRVNIFNLAHLDESWRQFVISLLLGRILAWSRGQPGTEKLRALVFFDEVSGYMPPHPANPPTKAPLLTMMKQTRAVGLGVVLATQNPVDLDYKALSNAGLWCVGRLSTPQDRERLVGGIGDRSLDPVVAGLQKRHFMVYEVGRGTSVIESRHSRCYLRGPFTRQEVALLAGDRPAPKASSRAAAPAAPKDDLLVQAPTVQGVSSFILDPRVAHSARLEGKLGQPLPPRPDGKTEWRPALYAELVLRFDEEKVGFVLDHHEHRVWFPLDEGLPESAVALAFQAGDLSEATPREGRFHPLPAWMDEKKELDKLQKSILDEVLRSESRGMWSNAALKLYGKAGETREDFDKRCAAAVEDRVDEAVAALEGKYKGQAEKIRAQIKTKEGQLAEAETAAKGKQMEEVVNVGETILSFFMGRKKSIGTAVSKRSATSRANEKTERLESELAELREKADALQTELANEVESIRTRELKALEATEEKAVGLEKADIRLDAFGILWVPVTRRA